MTRRVPGGEVTLLDRIDCDVRPGQWLAVLGANGSGKSSLLKFLASEDSPLSEPAAIMFQDPDEQIFAATVGRELSLGRTDLDVKAMLREFHLEGFENLDPRLLSAGQKQCLVLAVSLASAPRVLFCDEPTALQDRDQSRWVLDRLERWVKESGGALVTATCDRREAARADWLIVLHEGRISRQGPTREMIGTPEVRELLGTGDQVAASPGRPAVPMAEPLLELEDLGFDFAGPGPGVHHLCLEVVPGQRVGITGPNGCGKSTLLAACAGARRPDRGSVRLAGRELYRRNSRDLDHGAAMLAPQFPEYLFTRSDVSGEIRLDPAFVDREPADLLGKMGLSPDLAVRNPHDLSCGQKRRLALGLVLFSGRPVLLLDEPTAALDRAGRALVLELLANVDPETAVLVASHDLGFLHEAGCGVYELGPEGLDFLPGRDPDHHSE